MIAYTNEDWIAYIEDRVSAEQRRQMEIQLEQSDEALALYLHAMDGLEGQLPPFEEVKAQTFTDTVMSALYPASTPVDSQAEPDEPSTTPKARHRRWTEHPLFHYTVAAAITLLFMASGVFDALLAEPRALIEQPSGSLTQSILDTFSGWFGSKP